MHTIRRFAIALLVIAFPLIGAAAEKVDGYRMPPPELAALADAPPTPAINVAPAGGRALLVSSPALLALADLAQPEAKLAGLRFNPHSRAQTRASYATGLALLELASGTERPIGGLPAAPRLRDLAWSPDGRLVAFTHAAPDALELWLADAATAAARRLGEVRLNGTMPGAPCRWLPTSAGLVCRTVPGGQAAAPVEPRVPAGPVIQQTSGRKAPARTYQDLLRSPYEADLVEHHLAADVALVGVDGTARTLATGRGVTSAEPSPDGRFLLVTAVERPYSFLVPVARFPRVFEVWDVAGRVVRVIARVPLQEEVPTDFDAVPVGPRDLHWRADAPATAVWVEALDGGDPKAKADKRDRVLALAAPFAGEPAALASLDMRYRSLTWGRGDLALVSESWWKTRRTRTWQIAPDRPAAAPRLLFDRSSEDRYGDPGRPITTTTAQGTEVLRTSRDGRAIFLAGAGASSEGDRPFLDRFQLATAKAERLWRSQAPWFESVVEMLDEGTLLTRREGADTPPNYVVRDLARGAVRALTAFPHPAPQLAGVTKELIRYPRADGVMLSGTLYLPSGWTSEKGRLPVLLWAYPQEFKSADAAAQVTDSPYRFPRLSPHSPLYWLARGWAVLDDPAIPIVGAGEAEPNDTYVDQLVAGARAAVDELVRRGVGDRDRMAIGGHSYGAFMTANLLAHSDLFRAGIARSGAYNRTLTPFGFQAEERIFWQAPETYMAMSPFTHAEKIDEPILLLHGIDDNNSGTFPIQSERLYHAIKGLGGTARLVLLPYESHGYKGRESVMHMLWEMDEWLERHVASGSRESRVESRE